jgi:TolA-binding protein
VPISPGAKDQGLGDSHRRNDMGNLSQARKPNTRNLLLRLSGVWRIRAAGLVLGISLSALAAPGCTTSSEGEAMRHDIADLKVRLDAIDKRDAQYKEQVVRLKEVLDKATALLTRNSADVGAKAAKNESDIAAVTGRIEELNHSVETQLRQGSTDRALFESRLTALEATANKIADKVALTMPDDKEQLWSQAATRLSSGQREEGRRFYKAFIQKFPQDPRAPQAYLVVGQSFAQESKFPNAAAEFQKVLDNYSSSPEVPEAMWQLALTFSQLKFCTDARALLNDLVKRYPKSQRAGDAKNQVKQIAKMPKSACTS